MSNPFGDLLARTAPSTPVVSTAEKNRHEGSSLTKSVTKSPLSPMSAKKLNFEGTTPSSSSKKGHSIRASTLTSSYLSKTPSKGKGSNGNENMDGNVRGSTRLRSVSAKESSMTPRTTPAKKTSISATLSSTKQRSKTVTNTPNNGTSTRGRSATTTVSPRPGAGVDNTPHHHKGTTPFRGRSTSTTTPSVNAKTTTTACKTPSSTSKEQVKSGADTKVDTTSTTSSNTNKDSATVYTVVDKLSLAPTDGVPKSEKLAWRRSAVRTLDSVIRQSLGEPIDPDTIREQASQRFKIQQLRAKAGMSKLKSRKSILPQDVDEERDISIIKRESMAFMNEFKNKVQAAADHINVDVDMLLTDPAKEVAIEKRTHKESAISVEGSLVEDGDASKEKPSMTLEIPIVDEDGTAKKHKLALSPRRDSMALDQALVRQMLPKKVCVPLRQGKKVPPEAFDDVGIFFSDVVGFTNISATIEPIHVLQLLNNLFTVMDYCCSLFPLYKVETIGDAYMVAGGLPEKDANNAQDLADFALLVSAVVSATVKSPIDNSPIEIRMGCHTGNVMAGVVGTLMPRYCLFGDTVNTASRMESNGEAGRVHCSEAFANKLQKGERHVIEERGLIPIKGKGEMKTFWLLSAAENNDVSDNEAIKRAVQQCQELLADQCQFDESIEM